jgi:peroxiredoxin
MSLRIAVVLGVAVSLCSTALSADESPKTSPNAAATAMGLPADWSKEIELPTIVRTSNGGSFSVPASKLKLWVEQGWLLARFDAEPRGLEWEIVLAQATNPEPPTVKISERPRQFEVIYGPYFIRENYGWLRARREAKTAESPPWPGMPIDNDAKKGQTLPYGGRGPEVRTQWQVGDWRWLAFGLRDRGSGQERYDIWMRLAHRDLPPVAGATSGGYSSPDGIMDFSISGFSGHIEQDLFLARRSTDTAEDVARLVAEAANGKDGLIGKPAPRIAAENWINVAADTDGAELLKGKPALILFWSPRDASAGPRLWDCEQLYRRFKDRGFVVVALYPPRDSKDAPELAKAKDVSFAVGSDANAAQGVRSMENAINFKARSSPACFLIDKTGKVVWGNSKTPPTAEQIEAVLKDAESKQVP